MSAAANMRSRTRLWRDLFALLKEFWTAHPIASLGSLALLLVGNLRMGLYVIAMGGLIDAFVSPGTDSVSDVTSGRSVLFWLGMYIGASLVEELYWMLSPILRRYLLDHGTYRIQNLVLTRAAAAPLIQYEEGLFFTHLQRASAGMGERLVGLFHRLMDLGQLLIGLGSIAVALYLVHPALLPLLFAGSMPSVWLQAKVATAVYHAQRAHTVRDRLRAHLQDLLTKREAAPEVRLFGTTDYLLGRWRSLRLERKRDMLAAERRRALHGTMGSLVAGMTYATALVLVTALILRGRLSVGDYVAVTTGALWFQQLLGGLIATVGSLEEESQYLGDLFEFWRVAEVEGGPSAKSWDTGRESLREQKGCQTDVPVSAGKPAGRGMEIEASGVTFYYPGTERPVLRDISLRIERAERIAIVGENGAGKTTLVRLLTGLYQPDQGSVRLDGALLTEGHAATVRHRMAAVFQDYATFQLTLRENIGFGDLHRLHDDGALKDAAQRAGIDDLIVQLPQGLDSFLGRQFGDTDLSGGQWQRIALARAFLRDADLLVLDEPTAALDPKAELALFERFIQLVEGRTAIMISHRLGAARLADRIFVLRDGAIVEQGHHDQLVAAGGEYARLFAMQAQWYR